MPLKDDKYNVKNREKRREWARKKKLCKVCGKYYSASNGTEHKKTKYHNLVKQCREYIKNLVLT